MATRNAGERGEDMNYTKEDMENFALYAIKHSDLFYHTDLLEMWDKENKTALRGSQVLSEVPSDNKELIKEWVDRKRWFLGNDINIDEAVELIDSYLKFLKQRGIDG